MIGTLTSQAATRFILDPFQRFFQRESAGGIVLMVNAVLALMLANSPWKDAYFNFWHTKLTIGLENFALTLSLHAWLNDGLMAVFFFLVGLEIKRQFLVGELSQPKQALLPILAAFGGMLVPTVTYLLLNPPGTLYSNGWGVPSVTDIAFSLGILALLGKKVPLFLKVFLAALAIVDDLGAILVIALFYSTGINVPYLIATIPIMSVLFMMSKLKVRWILVYVILGIALWVCMLYSGIHPTIAGVLLALTIPATSKIKVESFRRESLSIVTALPEATHGMGKYANLLEDEYQTSIQNLETLCEEAQAPLQRLEHTLHPWVTYLIMPLFALANAGVSISADSFFNALTHPIALGIIAGLVVGKTLGIYLFSWLGVQLRIIEIPANIRPLQMLGLSLLGGIGFTMSLFIAGMAFHQPELDIAKIGTFLGSLISGVIGYMVLKTTLKSTNVDAAV